MQADYDAIHTRFIESKNFRVLRFWNSDILTNMNGVLENIRLALISEQIPRTVDKPNYIS